MGQVKETVREATIGKVERVMEGWGNNWRVTEPALEMGRQDYNQGAERQLVTIFGKIRYRWLIGLGVGCFMKLSWIDNTQ